MNLLHRLWNASVAFIAHPTSPRPLAALRIGVAAVLLFQAGLLAGSFQNLFGERGLVQWSISPLTPPTGTPTLADVRTVLESFGAHGDAALVVFLAYVGSLVCLLVGWQTRGAAIVAWLTHMALKTTGGTSIYGVDEFAHIALFYCVLFPVGAAWSMDRHGQPDDDEPSVAARLGQLVLQLHLCIVYFTSGIEKASGAQWWNGEAIWRAVMRPDLTVFDLSWLADFPELVIGLCFVTLVVEIAYPLMIWHRWTRWPWAAATIGMHMGITIFFGLYTFGPLMIALNVAALVVPATPSFAKADNPI